MSDLNITGFSLSNIELGIDCVEISRFENQNESFFQNGFTEREIKYCQSRGNPLESFAVRFTAKEAIMKAMMKYEGPMAFNEIEISNDSSGKPQAKILKESSSDYDIKISLSHSSKLAIAVALVFRK